VSPRLPPALTVLLFLALGACATAPGRSVEPEPTPSPEVPAPQVQSDPTPPASPLPPDPELVARVDALMAGLSLEDKVGQLMMVGFAGTGVDASVESLVRGRRVGGLCLFKRNIVSGEQVARLNDDLRRLLADGIPPFVALDQEGGNVVRVRDDVVVLPGNMALGATRSAELAYAAGRAQGKDLKRLGFNMNLAPVLDVNLNPRNPVIGIRSYGDSVPLVAELGRAFVRGQQDAGLVTVAKHFPGHGDTTTDSHLTLPRLPHDLERLRQVELVPFRAFAQAGLASLMTAHVLFDALDPGVPATMSQRVLQGVLREELGFDGVLVSDDLEMKAIADHYSVEEATVQGTLAGVDLFLVCHRADVQRRAIEALVKAVESGRVPHQRVLEAHRRLDALCARFAHPAEDRFATLGDAQHRALAEGLASSFAGKDPTEVMLASR